MACECSSTVLTCCSDNSSNFVQDKVCNPWSSAEASTFTVYANNVNQNIVGTGYLTYDVGPGVSPANQITVTVLDSGGGTIQTFLVNEGLAFHLRFAALTSFKLQLLQRR